MSGAFRSVTERNKDTVRRFAKAFEQEDEATVRSLFAPNFRRIYNFTQKQNADNFIRHMKEAHAALVDIDIFQLQTIAEGDTVVTVATGIARQRSDLKVHQVVAITVYNIDDDGKILTMIEADDIPTRRLESAGLARRTPEESSKPGMRARLALLQNNLRKSN